MEEYKYFFENYQISNFGNCRRRMNDGTYKKIEGSINNRGYRYMQLGRNGKRINFLFHHQVAYCFIGERPEELVIDHIDRNKLNNNVDNLRYITFIDNLRNCDRYLTHIKEQGKDRARVLRKRTEEKCKIWEKFVCPNCDRMTNKKHLKRHQTSNYCMNYNK